VVQKPLRPEDLAKRVADRRSAQKGAGMQHAEAGQWRRETFLLPRADARQKAQALFARFPKAAYMTEIEWWRECDDGQIEFTIRRLRSAD
jgi:hypothetical protein